MAENAPPPPANATADATRGIPYYEKLKRDLRETLQKKRLLDKNMASLEDQIFRFETSYLEETQAGNIIKGFDNYIKGSSTTGSLSTGGGGSSGTSTRRKGIMEADRVFSRSSCSFMRLEHPLYAFSCPDPNVEPPCSSFRKSERPPYADERNELESREPESEE
ncbi:MAG: hypothetical protein Q9214_002307 [Letrouitia sp. 1 TL-2023]